MTAPVTMRPNGASETGAVYCNGASKTGAVYCVVTAAGSGTRLGFNQPKALVPVAGVPMVVRAVTGMFAHPQVVAVVVTAPAEQLPQFDELFANDSRVRVAPGGRERQDSVSAGLLALEQFARELGQPMGPDSPVLIHDAARPLTPLAVVNAVVDNLRAGLPAVIPALPVTDTIKVVPQTPVAGEPLETAPRAQVMEPQTPVAGEPLETAPHAQVMEPQTPVAGESLQTAPRAQAMEPQTLVAGEPVEPVVGAADRAVLRGVQTPQGFHWGIIQRAHGLPDADEHTQPPPLAVTDDAALVESLGEPVYLCAGSELSMKVTTAFDLEVIDFLAARS